MLNSSLYDRFLSYRTITKAENWDYIIAYNIIGNSYILLP